ncbi:MAG: hypothetical protein LAN63_14770 [Acidobacteriia bacterium]|nr:hypothetical protein [Terriglobia bacterium]
MNLKIDNFDGHGPHDYSSAIDNLQPPRVIRKLNHPFELRLSLVADDPGFVVPVNGARVTLGRTNGQDVFTGYLAQAPTFEYLGWGERGPIYRYHLVARSDEAVLDRKRLHDRPPFVARSAGDALRLLAEDLLPGGFDTSGMEDVDVLAWYSCDPQKKWSEHAARMALQARGAYRAAGGALTFSPVGTTIHQLDETAGDFSPSGLKLEPGDGLINDITVVGRTEPGAYVKDYFVGDGYSARFYLSQTPFTRSSRTLVEEEYKDATLDPTRWVVADPQRVVSVTGGKLQVAGGTGADGQTTVSFAEKLELGGAFVLQHGDVTFSAASDGLLGGLYANGVSTAGCLAGFRIMRNGAESKIQAVVNGALTGPAINTVAGHHYAFTTRLYASEIYRKQQTFHSAAHPAGEGRGGADVDADVRVVLEVHDIDPADPGSLVAPSTVLYDAVLASAAGFCTYALVNSTNLQCAIAFTRLVQAVDAEVRSAFPGQSYRTRLVGSLADGAECLVTQDPALQFFPQSIPAPNELIAVHYRGRQRALARVTDPASIAAHQREGDDGIRGIVRGVQAPAPRTTADCENAALALLDDATGTSWAGQYQTWSDFLPSGSEDVFPGDAVDVSTASRGATFRAIVRQVDIEFKDLEGEHGTYNIRFADDVAAPLAFEFETAHVADPLNVPAITIAEVGTTFLPDLTAAEISQVTSTAATLDAGVTPPPAGGIEVRRSDVGWGQENDRNLVGRFTTRSFTVPRLARTQDYFLRQYDASTPAKYSRCSAALQVDYPL